jgi:hypothetical protein
MLTGGIPEGLTKLSKLTFLHLGTNMLTGNIPEGIGNLSKLQIYLLGYQQAYRYNS